MEQRFKIAAIFFIFFALVFLPIARASDETPRSERVNPAANSGIDHDELIVERMRSLAESLGGLPNPPRMDQFIDLPTTGVSESGFHEKEDARRQQ